MAAECGRGGRAAGVFFFVTGASVRGYNTGIPGWYSSLDLVPGPEVLRPGVEATTTAPTVHSPSLPETGHRPLVRALVKSIVDASAYNVKGIPPLGAWHLPHSATTP